MGQLWGRKQTLTCLNPCVRELTLI